MQSKPQYKTAHSTDLEIISSSIFKDIKKIVKTNISCVMSAYPFVYVEQLGSHCMSFTKFDI